MNQMSSFRFGLAAGLVDLLFLTGPKIALDVAGINLQVLGEVWRVLHLPTSMLLQSERLRWNIVESTVFGFYGPPVFLVGVFVAGLLQTVLLGILGYQLIRSAKK